MPAAGLTGMPRAIFAGGGRKIARAAGALFACKPLAGLPPVLRQSPLPRHDPAGTSFFGERDMTTLCGLPATPGPFTGPGQADADES